MKPNDKDGVWVFHLNFQGEIREKSCIHLPGSVKIRDSTIREGEETPGVCFSFEQKQEIVRMLVDAGIKHVDCGYVGVVEEQRD